MVEQLSLPLLKSSTLRYRFPVLPSHKNNIGAIRLSLAVLVMYAHLYPLTRGADAIHPLIALTRGQVSAGSLAVNLFFLLSGYLITKSWLSSSDALSFLRKRILRIYPGYLVALCVSLAVGAACARPGPLDYLRQIGRDNERLLRAALLLDYGVLDGKGAFAENPYPQAVNGSLWSLQPELYCYLFVAAAGTFGLFSRRFGVLIVCLVLHFGYALNLFFPPSVYPHFWCLTTYFAYGAVFYRYRSRIPLHSPGLVAAAAGSLLAGVFFKPLLVILMPAAGGYLLFSLAFAPYAPCHRAFDKWDLSYGVYIYSFPVQQACVYVLGIQRPRLLFLWSVPITLVLAWLSWTFVERPCLRRKGKLTASA